MPRLLRVWMWLPWALVLTFGTSCVTTAASAVPPSVTRTTFYDALSPYGEWLDVPPYGPVWRPYRQVVGAEFVPYDTGGRWVYTDYGWVFDTDWDWGWAPFHYGRWINLGAVEGWVWVPDTVWGPAWVDWRVGGGYVSWFPLPPANAAVVVGGPYEPVWIWVSTNRFQNGAHRGHVTFEPRGPPDSTVIPPRPAPDGHAWYSGPSPQSVSHDASVAVTPRAYTPPQPLPPGVLGTPKGTRMRSVPPRGQPAAGWSPSSEPSHASGSASPPREGFPPPAGDPVGPSAPSRPEGPRGEPGGSSGWQRSPPPGGGAPGGSSGWSPPAGSEQGPSQPPPGRSNHGEDHSPPPGRPGRTG